jgi:hypothetical protein
VLKDAKPKPIYRGLGENLELARVGIILESTRLLEELNLFACCLRTNLVFPTTSVGWVPPLIRAQ